MTEMQQTLVLTPTLKLYKRMSPFDCKNIQFSPLIVITKFIFEWVCGAWK